MDKEKLKNIAEEAIKERKKQQEQEGFEGPLRGPKPPGKIPPKEIRPNNPKPWV